MGFLDFLGLGKQSMIEKMSKKDISNILGMLPIDINQIMQIAETKAAEWLDKTQQEAGSKLLLMAELDETTGRVNIEFHKVSVIDGTTEHWKSINLTEITTFLNNLKTVENDTNETNNQQTRIGTATADGSDTITDGSDTITDGSDTITDGSDTNPEGTDTNPEGFNRYGTE